MRTALLAALRTTDTGDLRAGLALAGRSVLARQASLALALGYERVIVLAETTFPAVTEAEIGCREASAVFHHVTRLAELAALIHSEDELLILADGLLPDPAVLRALVAPRNGALHLRRTVFCLPDDDPHALEFPADFERIDSARCWAGVLVMRGGLVQELVNFPQDSDAISLLLRLALQAGTPCHTLTCEERRTQAWFMADSSAAVLAREQVLVSQYAAAARGDAPCAQVAAWLGGWLVQRVGAAQAHRTQLSALGAGLGLMLAALFAAGSGAAASALLLAAAGVLTLGVSAALAGIVDALMGGRQSRWQTLLHEPGSDILSAAILAVALAGPDAPLAMSALGLIVMASLRLAASGSAVRFAPLWRERVGQLSVLAIAAGAGLLGEAVAALCLAALAQVLFTPHHRSIPN